MYDIHCHLLPGIDDGPRTVEDALNLARALVDDGVTHVVTTPHVFPGRWDNMRSGILALQADFQRELVRAGISLQTRPGGEVRLCPEVFDLLGRQEIPFIGVYQGDHLMLLELPDAQIPLGSDLFVNRMLAQGVRPVIVHPERNKAVMEKPERFKPFIEAGCFVQLTAGSLVGDFGSRAQAACHYMLARNWVSAVASDAHNLGGRRPRMGAAREWLQREYGEPVAHRLTESGPRAMSVQRPELNVLQSIA